MLNKIFWRQFENKKNTCSNYPARLRYLFCEILEKLLDKDLQKSQLNQFLSSEKVKNNIETNCSFENEWKIQRAFVSDFFACLEYEWYGNLLLSCVCKLSLLSEREISILLGNLVKKEGCSLLVMDEENEQVCQILDSLNLNKDERRFVVEVFESIKLWLKRAKECEKYKSIANHVNLKSFLFTQKLFQAGVLNYSIENWELTLFLGDTLEYLKIEDAIK